MASAERGEFRSIRKVLLDGPDFQALSASARWTFVSLKLTLSFTGIGVINAAVAVLAEKTGLPEPEVAKAIEELSQTGWVKTQKNIFWIVNGLLHEPGFSPKSLKHKSAVTKHIDSLPHVEIVAEFKENHAEWFESARNDENQPNSNGAYPFDSLSKGYPELDSVENQPEHTPSIASPALDVQITNNKEQMTDDEEQKTSPSPTNEKYFSSQAPDLSDPLTLAVLEATGKLTAFKIGSRSPQDVTTLAQIVNLLRHDGRTVADVRLVADFWPQHLGKPPESVQPLSLSQFLSQFDNLLGRAKQPSAAKPKFDDPDELAARLEAWKKSKVAGEVSE